MEMSIMGIGERIRKRRKELKMSQEELANLMGYTSRSTIAKIESGANDITQSTIVKFADVLNTSIKYLMDWDTDEDDNDNWLNHKETEKDSKDSNKIRWLNEVGETKFNDDEMTQLINFAKYLISQRGNKQ